MSSIRVKALLLLVIFALAPLAVVVALLLPTYGEAVRAAEQRQQLVIVGELTQLVQREVGSVERDAQTLAKVLAQASQADLDAKAMLAVVRGVMQSTGAIDAIRFEVPSKKVDTVINRAGIDKANVPHSDEETRRSALKFGSAFRYSDNFRGSIIVPVPKEGDDKPQGFVVAPVYLRGLSDKLGSTLKNRDLLEAQILVVDKRQRLVAHHNTP